MTELVNQIADLSAFAALIGMVAFVIFYARLPWKSTLAGRSVMYVAIGSTAVFLSIVLSLVFGIEYAGREWVRLGTYGFLAFSTWNLLVTLVRLQRKGERNK